MVVTGGGCALDTLSVTATTNPTAAAVSTITTRTLAAREYSDEERWINQTKRKSRHGEEAKNTYPSVLKRERTRTAPFWSGRPWGAARSVLCNAGLTSPWSGGPRARLNRTTRSIRRSCRQGAGL